MGPSLTVVDGRDTMITPFPLLQLNIEEWAQLEGILTTWPGDDLLRGETLSALKYPLKAWP
jgi:hypothetical protein